ncbi:hypothetical protein A6R68_15460, partial [Neotoma lepida]
VVVRAAGRAAPIVLRLHTACSPKPTTVETCSLWPGWDLSLFSSCCTTVARGTKTSSSSVVKPTATCWVWTVSSSVLRDKFSYQKMIANLLLCSHPNPQKMLIIRGVDEGVLWEVVKHIDEYVIGYSSSKLTFHVGNGFEFMKQNETDAFDVIITDSSDPMGPTESLFKASCYQLGECQWQHLDLIKEMRHLCKSLFPVVGYAYCTISTYQAT